MSFERPILKLTLTTTDKLLERLAAGGILFLWAYTLYNYFQLSDTIPVHYNLRDEVNAYGSKATLFIMPCIITVVVIGLTILNRYPHIFSYPTA